MKRLSLLFSALFLMASISVFAQVNAVPQLMNFQGRLAKPDGTPVANGTYSVRFSLWDVSSGGTAGANEKWNQTVGSVTVKNGVFAVLLSGFPAGVFSSNLWLEIKIGSDAPLTPRQQLVSVAYAMKTDSIKDGGVTTNSLADNAVTTAKIADGTIASADFASDAASLNKVSGGALSLNSNRLFYPNGVIQNGGSALTGTTDLGLYSQINNQWMRFVTNNGPFRWYSDSGIGTNALMTLNTSGQLVLGGTGNIQSHLDITGNSNIGTWLWLRNTSTGGKNWSIWSSGSNNGEGAGKLILRSSALNLALLDNGNVGVGTYNPKQQLHNAGDYYGKGHLWLHAYEGDGNNGTAYIQARDDSSTSAIGMQLRTKNGSTLVDTLNMRADGRGHYRGQFWSDTNFSVGSAGYKYALSVEGDAIADNWLRNSDARLKEHITVIPDALSSLLAMRGVAYEWKADSFVARHGGKGQQYGFLAQEIEQVLPDLVQEGHNGYKAVNYIGILPVLVEAIKTQQSQIQTMKATKDTEIAELKAQVQALTEAVRQLQAQHR